MAKTRSGKARNMSIIRLRIASIQPPKKPAMTPRMVPITTETQRGEDRDEQRDAGAVEHPAEDVAPVDGLQAHRVLPAHAAEGSGREVRDDRAHQVLVVLVGRTPGDLDDQWGEDRDQDQEDDEQPAARATLSRRSRPQAIWLSERPSICSSPASTISAGSRVAAGILQRTQGGLPGSRGQVTTAALVWQPDQTSPCRPTGSSAHAPRCRIVTARGTGRGRTHRGSRRTTGISRSVQDW